jgi:hypothetical protein
LEVNDILGMSCAQKIPLGPKAKVFSFDNVEDYDPYLVLEDYNGAHIPT